MGHGCAATMAPWPVFESGGGSPGSIVHVRRQFWCATAFRSRLSSPNPPSAALEPPLQRAYSTLHVPCRYHQWCRQRRQRRRGHRPHAGHRRHRRRRRRRPIPPRRRLFFVDFAAFSISAPAAVHMAPVRLQPLGAVAAPGRRRVARARPGGGLGACQRPWGRQRRSSRAVARLRSCFLCSSCDK
jgi:hypothetical protein